MSNDHNLNFMGRTFHKDITPEEVGQELDRNLDFLRNNTVSSTTVISDGVVRRIFTVNGKELITTNANYDGHNDVTSGMLNINFTGTRKHVGEKSEDQYPPKKLDPIVNKNVEWANRRNRLVTGLSTDGEIEKKEPVITAGEIRESKIKKFNDANNGYKIIRDDYSRMEISYNVINTSSRKLCGKLSPKGNYFVQDDTSKRIHGSLADNPEFKEIIAEEKQQTKQPYTSEKTISNSSTQPVTNSNYWGNYITKPKESKQEEGLSGKRAITIEQFNTEQSGKYKLEQDKDYFSFMLNVKDASDNICGVLTEKNNKMEQAPFSLNKHGKLEDTHPIFKDISILRKEPKKEKSGDVDVNTKMRTGL